MIIAFICKCCRNPNFDFSKCCTETIKFIFCVRCWLKLTYCIYDICCCCIWHRVERLNTNTSETQNNEQQCTPDLTLGGNNCPLPPQYEYRAKFLNKNREGKSSPHSSSNESLELQSVFSDLRPKQTAVKVLQPVSSHPSQLGGRADSAPHRQATSPYSQATAPHSQDSPHNSQLTRPRRPVSIPGLTSRQHREFLK